MDRHPLYEIRDPEDGPGPGVGRDRGPARLVIRMERSVTKTEARLVTPVFVLIQLSTFAYFIGVGMLLPVLPLYVKGPLSGGNLAVGLAVGSFSLSALLLRPLAGRLSDRRGRRTMILAGGAVVAASVAGYNASSGLSATAGL